MNPPAATHRRLPLHCQPQPMFFLLIALGQWLMLFTGMATANTYPAVTRLARRAQPFEERADFIGWKLQVDGGYEAEFCTSGYTLTTMSNIFDCCPTDSSSACEFATGCRSGYLLLTVLTTAQSSRSFDCDFYVRAQACNKGYLYFGPDNWEAGNFTMYNCGAPFPSRRAYYRTVTPGATTTTTFLPTVDVPKATLVWAAPPPPAPASSTSSPSMTTSDSTTPVSFSGSGNGDTNATGDGGLASSTQPASPDNPQPGGQDLDSGSSANSKSDSLSRSDNIAIGIGLGVGLPTIIVALFAWFWPRQWLAQRKAHGRPVAVATTAPVPIVPYSGGAAPMAAP